MKKDVSIEAWDVTGRLRVDATVLTIALPALILTWERFAGLPDVAPETAERANLIYLVDRVDALAAPYYSGGGLLMHVATIRDTIAAHAGRYFSPRLVELFLAASASEAFWRSRSPRESWNPSWRARACCGCPSCWSAPASCARWACC